MDVCAAIARHNLQPFLRGRIAALAAHGWPAVLALLLDATDTVRPADVVAQLGAAAQPERTLDYLHGLFEADAAAAAPFAEQQLRLYAAHRRDDLLPFLRQSDHYPLRAALSICEEFAFLDTEPEEFFDQIALAASLVAETPMAAVSLLDSDRQ